jgi:methylmalonyl-CoA/ethylmalonyl-CoA epimerase
MAALRLHHVGIVVADIAKASGEYTGRLGYQLRSEIIHDPVQTAYVQFLHLPGDPALLELVAPDGPASKLSNALKKGGGLNHLCYETADINESCAALRNAGHALIQEPLPAVAFRGRRIAWLMGRDRVLMELVERAANGDAHEL